MTEFKSGFVCFVGRPNAGKSTLTNALVGSKVAITSNKPQTTRHTIRGILTRHDAQLIIIDTPGLSKPRALLQQRLNDLVYQTWSEVDVVAVLFPSDEKIGPGDQFILAQLANLPKRPKLVAIATKSDKVNGERMLTHLAGIDAAGKQLGLEWAEIAICAALTGDQVDEVAELLVNQLPAGPAWYNENTASDEPTEIVAAELIREAALEGVRDELPHSIAVEIDEMSYREGRKEGQELLDIFAALIVERDSQKGIMIGHKGTHIKQVGTDARKAIAKLLGVKVHLDLKVKVLKDWQSDPKKLNRLGF